MLHALLRWTGKAWELRDLGSSNGTFVEGERLEANGVRVLERGCTVAFGCPSEQWQLTEVRSPQVMAVSEGAETELMEGGVLPLPSAEAPRATIFLAHDGRIMLESESDKLAIEDQHLVDIDGLRFRVCIPYAVVKTESSTDRPESVRDLELEFDVSPDEEHIELTGRLARTSHSLGARRHNYVLLLLARSRVESRSDDLPESEQGWVHQDELCRWLKQDLERLNTDVCRIRKQFGKIGVLDPANIIERRPDTKELRIGSPKLHIESPSRSKSNRPSPSV